MCAPLATLRGHTVSLPQAVAATADPWLMPAIAQSAFLQAFGDQALAVEAATVASIFRHTPRPGGPPSALGDLAGRPDQPGPDASEEAAPAEAYLTDAADRVRRLQWGRGRRGRGRGRGGRGHHQGFEARQTLTPSPAPLPAGSGVWEHLPSHVLAGCRPASLASAKGVHSSVPTRHGAQCAKGWNLSATNAMRNL